MRIVSNSIRRNSKVNEGWGNTVEYNFDTSSLTGEEMLVLDELLTDMLVWGAEDDADGDRVLNEIDDLFAKYYNRYLSNNKGYQSPNSGVYEDDKAWMFAENNLINHHLYSLTDDTIKYYLEGKKLNDEQRSVLDKCMYVKQQKREPSYSVCDRYDFGPWTKYESVKSENLIDTEYSHTKDIAKDKEYFKNKYEKKGYKNVRVKKVKSDTKGLPMYEIYGDKEVNESLNEDTTQYNMINEIIKKLGNRTIKLKPDNKIAIDRFRKLGYKVVVDKDGDSLYNLYKKTKNESLNESNDEDMGYKLGKWLGARLLTGWTAMLNVDGAEESPDYDEYDQQFDGTFVQCLNKLKEYQNIIDRDGIDAYLALQSSHDEYFDGDYDNIIDKLYDRGYLYDDDIDESLDESFNVSDETIEDAVEYYRENAFGFNGLKNYVETDFSHLPKEARDEIYKKMKKKLGESLNENCNSYSYKGKTIINAGDYWFVKGYEEKFPTSDEAEEFIDDKKKDEGVNINIRESLNKMDAESDNTYDLLNLYESKNLSRKQKKDIARMIYENYGLERIYNYLYEATEESEDELPVEDRIKELTNDFKNTNGSYVFEDGQDANKAISILKSRGYDASQKRTQDGKYRVTADKKNK